MGRYAKISEKITISSRLIDKFIEIYANIAVDRQFGYKRGNVPGLNSPRGLPKTVFWLRWPKLLHNLGLYILINSKTQLV